MSFTAVVRTSHSIPKALLEFSRQKDIDIKLLDFELITYDTLLKTEDEEEYQNIENANNISLEDKRNPKTQILQKYTIKIKPYVKDNEQIILSFGVNKLKTKAVLTIKEGSIFHKYSTLIQNLKNKIWARKLRAGLLIDIFEDALDAQLAKLFKLLPDNQALKKDLKFHVALGVEPIAQIGAKYEKIFETLNPDSHSIIDGVEKGMLILKYIKAIPGVDGRACNGKFMQAKESDNSVNKPNIDETILKKEYKEYIDYFSNDEGYVLLTKTDLKISKTLNLKSANFKSTANIDVGEDKDITVHIGHKQSDNEDAIGSGVNIYVKELSVEGSVAANVQIQTQDLSIDAQTHKDSHMNVENTANIKLHRGDLTTNEANIDVLEGGKVTAHKSVYIRQMVGGIAIAPIVKVDELISNSTIIASELIEIKTILGFDNKLIIDPHAIEDYSKDIENLKEKIALEKKSFDVQTNNLREKIKEHASRIDRIKTFKQRILLAQKSGRSPVKQDILRIRQYKIESDALKESQAQLINKETELQKLNEKLDLMYNKDLYAKITCKTTYDGTSKIIFKNSKTKEEVPYIPHGSAPTISIVLNEDKQRVIKIS